MSLHECAVGKDNWNHLNFFFDVLVILMLITAGRASNNLDGLHCYLHGCLHLRCTPNLIRLWVVLLSHLTPFHEHKKDAVKFLVSVRSNGAASLPGMIDDRTGIETDSHFRGCNTRYDVDSNHVTASDYCFVYGVGVFALPPDTRLEDENFQEFARNVHFCFGRNIQRWKQIQKSILTIAVFFFWRKQTKKSNLNYTCGITRKRVPTVVVGIHLHGLVPGQHSSDKTSQRRRAVGDTVFDLTSQGIEPKTSCTNGDARKNCADWPVK